MKCSNTIIPDVISRLCFVVLVNLIFLSSCAEYETPRESLPVTGPAIMEVSPWAVVVGSGTTHIVFVKVMDRDKNPIPNQTVFARVEDPSVATIEESELTDEKGLARFTVTGIGMPWYSKIIFTTDSTSTYIDVWKRGYGPYWHGRW